MDVPRHYDPHSVSRGSSTIVDGAYGRASLLLTESLMHCLVEKGMISREDFIGIVDDAAEVERSLGDTNAPCGNDEVASLLYPLTTAFRRELGQ